MHCRRMSLASRSSGRDARTTPARTPALLSAIPSMKHEAEVSETDLDPDISGRSAGVPPAVAGSPPAHTPRWAELVATFFGIGRLRPGGSEEHTSELQSLAYLVCR